MKKRYKIPLIFLSVIVSLFVLRVSISFIKSGAPFYYIVNNCPDLYLINNAGAICSSLLTTGSGWTFDDFLKMVHLKPAYPDWYDG